MAEKDTPVLLGPFRLFRNQRILTLDGCAVGLPPDALDLLNLLLARPGQDVDARALEAALQALHPGSPVDLIGLCEALNHALAVGSARHFIAQMREGTFRFHGELTEAAAQASPDVSALGGLPMPARDLVDRDRLIARGLDRIRHTRLLTLLGAGGVGKTTAAVLMARTCRSDFAHGVCFVNLAPIRQPGAAGQAVLLALGLEPGQGGGLPSVEEGLHRALQGKQLLVVLDNCEHLIEEAASLVELMLRMPGIHVLATSREPLKTFGETLLPVGPMEVPPDGTPAELATALGFAAVELFLARAVRSGASRALIESELDAVYDICRRLDGIPLALELAAAHVASLGLDRLMKRLAQWPAASLENAVISAPRHQTLEATFDWSYALLAPQEKTALRRIAVFRGEFQFDSAVNVVSLGGKGDVDAIGALVGLQSKSMLSAFVTDDAVCYRLLETTRDYALLRLREDAEEAAVRREHAVDCMHRLQESEREWSKMNGRGWLSRYGRHIEDVRQAVEWGLGSSGDIEATADLVVHALPLASRLALFDESHDWLVRALNAVCRVDKLECRRLELQLLVSLRAMAAHTKRDFDELPGSDERILDLVEQLGDDRHTAGACMSVWFASMNRAHYPSAVAAARKQLAFAERRKNTVDTIDALKVNAYALHFWGDQAKASDYSWRALALTKNNVPASYYNVVGCDVRVSVRIVLARALWIAGRFREAAEMSQTAMTMALEDRPLAVCLVLSYVSCPLALLNGELDEARARAGQLEDWSRRHNLLPHADWATWYGLCCAQGEAIRPSDVPDGLAPDVMQADMLATLGCDWLVDATARRVTAGLVGWCAPEVIRRQGERHLRQRDTAAARTKFEEAISLARLQQSAAWELRASLSLAGLDAGAGNTRAAASLLEPLSRRMDFSYGTADTRRAMHLLGESAAAQV